MVTVLARWNTRTIGLIKIILLEFNRQHVHFLFASVPHVIGGYVFKIIFILYIFIYERGRVERKRQRI